MTRRRVKSAQEPLHRQLSTGLGGHASSPPTATPRYPRNNRLSGPPVMGIAVPVIKTEKEQFEMSPLRDDCFNIDLQSDQHKFLTDDNAAIKIEPDMDCLDFCINESLEGLMGSYPFENESDIKPDIKSNEKDFSPTVAVAPASTASSRSDVSNPRQAQQPTSVPTGDKMIQHCLWSQSNYRVSQKKLVFRISTLYGFFCPM